MTDDASDVGDVFDSLDVTVHDDIRSELVGRCVIPLQKVGSIYLSIYLSIQVSISLSLCVFVSLHFSIYFLCFYHLLGYYILSSLSCGSLAVTYFAPKHRPHPFLSTDACIRLRAARRSGLC